MSEMIKLSDIDADFNFNCRGFVAPGDVTTLAQSIKDQGLISPVVVRPVNGRYALVAGFRRFVAHKLLKRDEIEAIVRTDLKNEVDAKFINLAENLERSDLNILQEAKAVQGLSYYGYTRNDIADRLGKSGGWVQIREMLLDMPENIQVDVCAGILNQTQLRRLYSWKLAYGTEVMQEKAKAAKNVVLQGGKGRIHDPQPRKKVRHKEEIYELVEAILRETKVTTLTTRCLAWAAGGVSDDELDADLFEEFGRDIR